MIQPLGVSLFTWGGIFALGGVAGLVLAVAAKPEGSALPAFARSKRLPMDVAHFLYGGLAAVGGVLAVQLFGSLAHPLLVAVAWAALLLALAWGGAEPENRRGALVAHAKVVGAIAALLLVGFVVTEYVILG